MGGLAKLAGAAAGVTAIGAAAFRAHLPTPVLYLLGHAAVTGALLSVAASDYACHSTPWLLGKKKDGHFIPGARLMAWPFHALMHLRINLRRMRSKEPLYSKIADGWYISGWPHRPDVLPHEADLCVIDCTNEYPRCHSRPYMNLPTWDTTGVSVDNVAKGVEYASQQRRLGRAVLVHCAHGHGRSAEVLLACMLAEGVYTDYKQGLAEMQKRRPKVRLNGTQRANLEAYLASTK